MARFVGSVGTSRDLYWGLKSTGDGLESRTNSGPCGTASGVALELVLCACCGSTLGGQEPCQQSELTGGKEGILFHAQPSSCFH